MRKRIYEGDLTEKEKEIVLSYADNDMVLMSTSYDVGIDYRTVSNKLDIIYKKSKLNPKRFHDLVKLVQMLEAEKNGHTG